MIIRILEELFLNYFIYNNLYSSMEINNIPSWYILWFLEIMSNIFGKSMDKWYFSHKEKTNIDLKIKAWNIYGLLLWVRKTRMLLWFRKYGILLWFRKKLE